MSLALVFDQPNLEPVRFTNGKQGYALQEPWSYRWDVAIGGVLYERELRFPVGFLSDGASVPRCMWSLTGISPDGLIRGPAFVHDALYAHRGHVPDGWLYERPRAAPVLGWGEVDRSRRVYSRQTADRIFRRIMRAVEMDELQVFLAYHGVRMNVLAWRRPYRPLVVAEWEL